MPYLTHDEYKTLGFAEIDDTEFTTLLPRASDVIDSITGFFYVHNDLESDITFRRKQFKKAVACQIEYFHEVGGTSTHQINSPLTVNMGRTQVMTGEGNQRRTNRLISEDVYMHLRYTGLLYRGVGVIG